MLDAMVFLKKDTRQWSRRGFEKPMFTQDNMDLRLIEPFDDGTIVAGEVVDDLVFTNFITGPEIGTCLPSLSPYMNRQRIPR
jgi:hypothetical protein